jgi:hypothetical protein
MTAALTVAVASCPACGSVHGTPIETTAHDWKTDVTYRCDACRYEWTVSREDPERSMFSAQASRR